MKIEMKYSPIEKLDLVVKNAVELLHKLKLVTNVTEIEFMFNGCSVIISKEDTVESGIKQYFDVTDEIKLIQKLITIKDKCNKYQRHDTVKIEDLAKYLTSDDRTAAISAAIVDFLADRIGRMNENLKGVDLNLYLTPGLKEFLKIDTLLTTATIAVNNVNIKSLSGLNTPKTKDAVFIVPNTPPNETLSQQTTIVEVIGITEYFGVGVKRNIADECDRFLIDRVKRNETFGKEAYTSPDKSIIKS